MSVVSPSAQTWIHPLDLPSVPLDRFLREHLSGASWNQSRRLIARGCVRLNGQRATAPTVLVTPGAEVVLDSSKGTSHKAAAKTSIVYLDSQVIVADKPTGISTVPFDDSERDSLWHRVRASLGARQGSPHAQVLVVHRIDKETSGLVVFARTQGAWKHLKQLFRVHAVQRCYLALAHGRVTDGTIQSRLVADRGDGRRGSTRNPRLGREAVTHIRTLEHFGSATLIECRLETGRTHQIRIHLSEAGHPLLGERVYAIRGLSSIAAPRVMLHARTLGFQHPTTGELRDWSLPVPDDMNAVIEILRRSM